MSKTFTLKRELKLKSGEVYPIGKEVKVEFTVDSPIVLFHGLQDEPLKILLRNVPAYLGIKVPSIKTLEKWNDDGISKTVTGHKVEPDGYGPDGSPSWLLVLGMI
jgi:hypothetical protein